MTMCEIAVMFDAGEMALIQANADAANMSFSEFARSAALDKAEEVADIKAFNDALTEDDGTRYSTGTVIRMAMKDEQPFAVPN